MYWRVRKYGTDELLKQYGVYGVLALSLLINIVLFATRPDPHKIITKEVKTDLEEFAKRVTQHILDTSYISYTGSTASLVDTEHGELAPPVVAMLKQQQQLPRSPEELKAILKTYADQKRVSAIRIDEVNLKDPNSQSLVPIVVTGVVAVHSAEESDPGPVHFRFEYLVGYRPNTQIPIVASFRDISPSDH